jgi:hypothetical protein
MVKIGLRELISSSNSSRCLTSERPQCDGLHTVWQTALSSFFVRVNLILPFNLPPMRAFDRPASVPKLKCLSDTQKEHQLDGPRTGYQNKEEEKVSIKARGTI